MSENVLMSTKQAMEHYKVSRDVITYLKQKISFIKKNNKIYYAFVDLEKCLNPKSEPENISTDWEDRLIGMSPERLYEYQNKPVLNCTSTGLANFCEGKTHKDIQLIFEQFDFITLVD